MPESQSIAAYGHRHAAPLTEATTAGSDPETGHRGAFVNGGAATTSQPDIAQGSLARKQDGRWTKGGTVILASFLKGCKDRTLDIAVTLPHRVAPAA